MSCVSRSVLLLIGLLVLTSVACGGEPPDKEMQQAQGAIDAARAAGADQYASEEFAAAQTALNNSTEAVAQRDYRLALNHALDSRERARNAAKMAADSKAVARVDADRAVSRADAALEALRAAVATAETSRTAPRLLAAPRKVIATAERQVQEARTLYEQGDYLRATATAREAAEPISAALKGFERPPAAPARRRR
jgi:hypothetical protein